MPNYVALNKRFHSNAGVRPVGFGHALARSVVPLVAEEIAHVLPTMPVGFVRRDEDETYELVALQSLEPNTNLYVHPNGRWIGGYQPAWYREYPFRLIPSQVGGQRVLCVDETATAFEVEANESAERIFDDNGKLSEKMERVVSFLQKLEQARQTTRVLVTQLAEAGLLVPWAIKTRAGSHSRMVSGVYQVDEGAMRAMEPESVTRLLKSGALSLAHAQLLSKHRLASLSRLYELRSVASEGGEQSSEVDLEDLFGGDDDDDLSFNF